MGRKKSEKGIVVMEFLRASASVLILCCTDTGVSCLNLKHTICTRRREEDLAASIVKKVDAYNKNFGYEAK